MKRIVRGIKYSCEDNFVENVYYQVCKNIDEMKKAVDEAFEKGADTVIIERKRI